MEKLGDGMENHGQAWRTLEKDWRRLEIAWRMDGEAWRNSVFFDVNRQLAYVLPLKPRSGQQESSKKAARNNIKAA
jgi:hypothetical protein